MRAMSKRGVALITVLLAAALLAMLVTSLVIVSRGNLVSGEQYRRREVLLKTCYSGLDYARARLTQKVGWGTSALAGYTFDDANLHIEESGAGEADNLVSGKLKGSGAQFEVRVINNLKGTVRLDPPLWSLTKVKVAPHCALVQVVGTFEGIQRKFEVELSKGTLITNSVTAGGSVAANVTQLTTGGPAMEFTSTMPRGNTLRAQGDIYLPDITRVDFTKVRGLVQSGAATTVNASVSIDDYGNPHPITSPNAKLLNGNNGATSAAANQIHAQFRLGSSSATTFSPDKLRKPETAPLEIPPGTYTFLAQDRVQFTDIRGGIQTFDENNKLPGVEFKDYRFIPQGNVQVRGDLKIDGMVSRRHWVGDGTPNGGRLSDAAPTPLTVSLGLGYDPKGIPKASADAKDRLTVAGNLIVKGDLVGNGQIFVNKVGNQGGNLDVVGNSFLSSTRTDGLAVATQGMARFREVEFGFNDMPAAMAPDDLKYYQTPVLSQNLIPASAAVLANFHGSGTSDRRTMVGSIDEYGQPGLRNQPINDNPAFTTSYGGIDLNLVKMSFYQDPRIPGVAPVLTAKEMVTEYIRNVTGAGTSTSPAKPLTLGQYVRIREFIKSIDLGDIHPEYIDTGDPHYETLNDRIQAAILNQVQAFDQDARNKGKALLDYIGSTNPNVYSNGQELIFGGILYSDGNVLTRVTTKFNLFGAIIAQGNVGFDHLIGRFVFDPSLVEDQFELSQLGLVPVFFWTD
jgi:hypothetical protein